MNGKNGMLFNWLNEDYEGTTERQCDMDIDRKKVTEEILSGIAGVLTIDEMKQIEKYFNSLSDADFFKVLRESAKVARNMSYKDVLKAQKDIRMTRKDITGENSALNLVTAPAESIENSRAVFRKIDASKPSDHICITAKEDDVLMGLWRKEGSKNMAIPSDLFFAETIPLTDFVLTVDETALPGGCVTNCRIVVFPDYAEKIEQADDETPVMVGAVVVEEMAQIRFYMPFYVLKGVDSLLSSGIGFDNYTPEFRNYIQGKYNLNGIIRTTTTFLATWYGIQIALLHPQIKEAFQKPRTEKISKAVKSGKNKIRHEVRYIKKHIIRQADLEEIMQSGSNYARHTFVWYVIGHWRLFSTGEKCFVKPYWKGPLRELKTALSERSREIVVADFDIV